MAGGTAGDIRTPYPKGEDGLFMFEFHGAIVEASKSADFIFNQMTVPFAFKAVKAEYTALEIAITNAMTVNIQDDTATPEEIITDAAVAAITEGAGGVAALTVDKTKTINAGAILSASYGSGAGDTAKDLRIRLWVKPVF